MRGCCCCRHLTLSSSANIHSLAVCDTHIIQADALTVSTRHSDAADGIEQCTQMLELRGKQCNCSLRKRRSKRQQNV